jgi:serine protease Do
VVALARPGGRELRATLGFVAVAERSFRGPRGRRLAGMEHTASLPRGSAGGPLLDASGRLLGLNALRLEGGLILALATTPLAAVIERLAHGETPTRHELGVAIAPPRVARRLQRAVGLPERDGALIRAVQADSPAAKAGLRRGDLIVGAEGREVTGVDVLYSALEADRDGPLALRVVRGDEERDVQVSFARDGTDS